VNASPLGVEEYKEAGSALRHYGTLRAANLTLFGAIMAGMFSVAFRPGDDGPSSLVRLSIKALAILIVGFFAATDARLNDYWFAVHARAKELEQQLGLDLYQGLLPGRRLIGSQNSIRALFVCIGLLWLVSFLA
jgi:hypothetical protein